MVIHEEVFIAASPETVWGVFSDIDNWKRWNPVCRECRLESGQALQPGACISFQLNPVFFPIRIAPVVSRCKPGQTVVWTGAKWGLRAEHTFLFAPVENGTRLESIEQFSGLVLWPLRLAGLPRRLHQLTQQLLAAIKSAAENQGKLTGN